MYIIPTPVQFNSRDDNVSDIGGFQTPEGHSQVE